MIELGASGPVVRAWQRIVGAKADGNFGEKTGAAVKAWQASRGVESDGVIGPLTRAVVQPGDLIKPYEGCVLQTYDDAQDVLLSRRLLRRVNGQWRRPDGSLCRRVPTIGWGDTAAPRRGVEFCTQAEADAWFLVDLENTRLPAVRRYVTGDAAQVCAAASFAYNCGTGALAKLAAAKFDPEWWATHYVTSSGIREAGLVLRRAEEAALWAST